MTLTSPNTDSAQTGALKDVASERRQALSLVHYWDHLRGERSMPRACDVEKEHELIQTIWAHCFIVEIKNPDSGKPDYDYTHLGASIVDAYKQELAGAEADGMASPNAAKLIGAYDEVITTLRPVLHTGEYDNKKGGMVKFRQCLLPLGEDKAQAILGYLNYYVYTK